jgi:signal transduction histidine kinase
MKKKTSNSIRKQWSLRRRLLWITLFVVLGQSLVSLLINHSLRQHLIDSVLRETMKRQTASILEEVNDRLHQLRSTELKICCSFDDYQNLLSEINLVDGKAAMIFGSSVVASSRSPEMIIEESDLLKYASEAMKSSDGFAVIDISPSETLALQRAKLAGGRETGSVVYIRPVYGMPLLRSQNFLKLGTELILILLTGLFLILSTRRPLRTIKNEISTIDLSNLEGNKLPTADAPTELLPILEEFNIMVDRLQLSSANQKQFAATISHEFRTPLAVTSGFIQSVMYRAKNKLTNQQLKSLETADQEILRLNRMLSDLLDLSRADNHQLSIRREAFEIIPAVDRSLRIARAAYTNPIRCKTNEIPYLEAKGDPDRLVQCIENLIGNAVKYSEEGASIDIEVNYGDDDVEISVIDHGPGIASDQFERIFERFKRGEGVALVKGQSSTGLGLSIVKMLMEAMGGKVDLNSKLGEGSSFNLRLPLAN